MASDRSLSSPTTLGGVRGMALPLELARAYGVTVAVAAGIFWLGYDGGTYSATSRYTVAVAVWWAIVLGVAFGVWPRARPRRVAIATGWLLAAYTAWVLASLLWTTSAERSFIEFDRLTLYLGLFAVALLTATRENAGRWSNGLALGVTAIALLALTSRFFPHVVAGNDSLGFLAGASARLSYPLGYWNALAILAGIGIPLLLRAALVRGGSPLGAVALAPIPALAGVIYLASSRGGVIAAIVGTIVFVVVERRRWAAAWAVLVAGVGSVGALAVLLARDALVDHPGTKAAVAQGRSAALLFALIGVAAGVVFALGSRFVGPRIRSNRGLDTLAVTVVVVVAVVGLIAAHPIRRFDDFKRVPAGSTTVPKSAIQAHLVSINGNGRWQYWSAAYHEWKTEPLHGRGAGSFEAWWAQHGTISGFVRDAHSLYAETLGELGVVGLALLLAAFITGFVGALVVVRRTDGDERSTLAALVAAFSAFAVTAAGDWMWEMTVVGAVGILALGVAVGPARGAGRDAVAVPGGRRSYGTGVMLILAGWAFIFANAIPLLTNLELRKSQREVDSGNGAAALSAAQSARNLQPWAASPYLQLALVAEQQDLLHPARVWIGQAIDRDTTDWRLPLVAARIDVKLGRIRRARREVDRAAQLNPRSSLFAGRTASSSNGANTG